MDVLLTEKRLAGSRLLSEPWVWRAQRQHQRDARESGKPVRKF
jgi:hypothetical protein